MKKSIRILLIVISLAIFLAFSILIVKTLVERKALETTQVSVESTNTPQPSATPIAHDPFYIIDASNMNISGSLEKMAGEIAGSDNLEVTYYNCDYEDIDSILDTYASINDSKNIVIIAPEDILNKLSMTFDSLDISNYSYTNMTDKNPSKSYVPFAYSVYSYLIRYDIAQDLVIETPKEFVDLMEFSRAMGTESGVYGFAVSADDTTSAMMARQMTSVFNDDNAFAATVYDFMWHNQCIPPDSGMIDDMGVARAYAANAVGSVFVDGYGLNYIYENSKDMYDRTYILNYLGQQASFAVRPVSIGVAAGSNADVVYTFVDKLYADTNEIFTENIGFVPVVNDVTIEGPYASLLSQTDGFIYYYDEYQSNFLESIVYYSLPIEEVVRRK